MTSKKISVDILGMTCAACSTRVEKALNKQDGVKIATVNLLANRATIEFDADKIKEGDIINTIKKTGYEVPLEKRTLTVEGMT